VREERLEVDDVLEAVGDERFLGARVSAKVRFPKENG